MKFYHLLNYYCLESFYFVEFHSNFFKFEKNCQIKSDKEKQFEFLPKFSIDIIMENFNISQSVQPDRADQEEEERSVKAGGSSPVHQCSGRSWSRRFRVVTFLSGISRMLTAAATPVLVVVPGSDVRRNLI